MSWDKKCLGKSRVVRRDLSTNSFYTDKLDMLATSCDLPPFTLASLIITKLLDTPDFVFYVQKYHNIERHYWVDTEIINGETVYKMNTISVETNRKKPLKSRFIDFTRDTRIKISISNDHDLKLACLSKSCHMKKAEMLAIMLHYGLDSSNVIMYFQDRYNKHKHYWVTPFEQNGLVTYLLAK